MAGNRVGLIDRFLQRRMIRRWQRMAEQAPGVGLETLRLWRLQARSIRREVDRLIHEAEHRLALPVIGANPIRRPASSDWAWRPELWRGPISVPGMASLPAHSQVCDGISLYHDCRQSEVTFRQIRNTRESDVAPFGLRLDVFRFDGSFLSLVVDLPDEAARGLRLRHVVRLDVIVEMEKPLEFFARLNVKHGPNIEQVVRELPVSGAEAMVEFDLAYTRINEKRVEKLWIDLIFDGPEMNQIILRDVTVSRRPRAEL